jgi:hypothetical protein
LYHDGQGERAVRPARHRPEPNDFRIHAWKSAVCLFKSLPNFVPYFRIHRC